MSKPRSGANRVRPARDARVVLFVAWLLAGFVLIGESEVWAAERESWPRRIEVPSRFKGLGEEWVDIGAYGNPDWSFPWDVGTVHWYGRTDTPLTFTRQGKRIYVSRAGGQPVLAGVMVTTAKDISLLARELARAEHPITVWACMGRWRAIAALPNLDKVESIVEPLGFSTRDPISGRSECVYDGWEEVGCLKRFPNLRSVVLGFLWHPHVLEQLRPVRQLEALRIHTWPDLPIDLTPLASLPRLRSLSLTGKYTGQAVLPRLKELRSLELNVARLRDYVPAIERCRRLRHLAVSAGDEELECDFSGLTDLESLEVSLRAVPDLKALSPCKKLRRLSVHSQERFPVIDLEPLRELPRLRHFVCPPYHARDCSVIAQLRGLRSLRFPRNASSDDLRAIVDAHPDLQWAGVTGGPHTDLSPLTKLRQLKTLDVHIPEETTSLGFLRQMDRLESLWIWKIRSPTDLAALGALKHLKHLAVSFSEEVTDVSFLAGLEELRTLKLDTYAGNLDFLASLKKLIELRCVAGGQVLDLRALTQLRDLISLEVRCHQIDHLWEPVPDNVLAQLHIVTGAIVHDLSPLGRLQRLERLSLTVPGDPPDMSALRQLRNLETLELEYCRPETDLSFLEGMSIHGLTIHGVTPRSTKLPTLSWHVLASLENLESMELFNVRFAGPSTSLHRLKQLFSVELSGCRGLTSTAPLATLPALEYVYLDSCDIEDYLPLGRIPNLRVIHFSGTWEIDTAFLREARKLEYFGMAGGVPPNDIGPIVEFARRGGYVYSAIYPEFDEKLRRAIESARDKSQEQGPQQ